MDNISGFGRNIERAKTFQKKCAFCRGTNNSAEKCFKKVRQEKEKYHAAGSSGQQTNRTDASKMY